MIEVKDISIRLGDFQLQDVSFAINKGDYLAILGVSGAGKSVILDIISGLLKPTKGSVLIDGADVTRSKIQDRKVGVVYQDLSLFPHLSVMENIAYPLRLRRLAKNEIKSQVCHYAEMAGVLPLLHRSTESLSGGEAQRVALARTLASGANILLLDEPLSSLDVGLKSELRGLLREINKTGITVIHVTHDFMEAATLANKVGIIEKGKLIQFGTPTEVFRHPKTEFVARFSGIKNIFGTQEIIPTDNRGLHLASINETVSIYFLSETAAKRGFVMVRHEDIVISPKKIESSALNQFRGIVREIYFALSGMELVVDIGVELVASISQSSLKALEIAPNSELWVSFKASSVKYVEA